MTFFLRPVAALAAGLTALTFATPAAQAATTATPKIGHVWTIVLENSEFEQTFVADRNNAPYLTQTLPSLGELVVQYYGTGHSSLDNYIAMTSGQGPNSSTQGDCDDKSVLGGWDTSPKGHFDADGQFVDDTGQSPASPGCTYPKVVPSIAGQLQAKKVTWKGYMENMDAQPNIRPRCASPGVNGPQYATPPRTDAEYPTNPDYKDKHNPFAYYHALTDQDAYCQQHVVPLGYLDANGQHPQGQLIDDLKSVKTTPAYSFLTPDQCHDGHDACGSNSDGLVGADEFLKAFVPPIMASPAYKQNGLIVIIFDEGSSDLSCCGEKRAPNLDPTTNNNGGVPGPTADGGGDTGAILLSPFITPNTTDASNQFNHYSYLRSMEDLFGLAHLGYAAQDGLTTFQSAGDFGTASGS